MSEILSELIQRYPKLSNVEYDIKKAYEVLNNCYIDGGKLLIAGNGGSCADSEHICGELMKSFTKKRPLEKDLYENMIQIDANLANEIYPLLEGALAAISLTSNSSLATAVSNDTGAELVFAQQIIGIGNKNDVFLGISTSGNSKNILTATLVAKAKGMKTIALTGKDGGKLKDLVDVAIVVPENETYKIQELHMPIYHALCLMLEDRFF